MRTREQIANICWIIEKAREFQKNIDLCFIDYTKAFDCVDHNKLWKALKEMGIQDHFIHILRNLYLGNKQQLKPCMEQLTGSRFEQSASQGCLLSSCLFNLYAEHIMRNAGLNEFKLEKHQQPQI